MTGHTTAPSSGIPQRGGKYWNRDDWLPMKGEAIKSYMYRLTFEGHTGIDAFLTMACAGMGQIMLNNPYALYSTGMIPGLISWFWALLVGFWTTWNYISLYLEFKRDKIKDGGWWDTNGEHKVVVQWFEVVGHHLGAWARWFCLVIIVFTMTGACVAQTVASANSMYTIDPSRTKREWSLIFGGSMVFLVVLTPTFTKFRLLNIFGIAGTFYATCYALDQARAKGWVDPALINKWPVDEIKRPGTTAVQNWFNGVSILITEGSSHMLIIESMEAMENPVHYKYSYMGGILYIIFVSWPHAILLNVSKYAPSLLVAQNMFQLFPVDDYKRTGVILMIIHQYIAYMLWGTQVCIAVEKVVGVHTQAYWKRVLVRLPLAGLWWFLALLLPFYASINSLLTSMGNTVVSFSLLAAASMKIYWRKERRDIAVFAPYKWLQAWDWKLVHAVNAHIVITMTGFGFAALYYACLSIKQTASSWGFMPECYLCPPTAASG